MHTEQAPDFTPVQKKTMLIISVAFVVMVVPGIMHTWLSSPFWGMLAGICQPQVVMVTAAFLCSVLKLAPEREVVKTIPIHTIIMIAGVYMLIKVSVEAIFGDLDKVMGGPNDIFWLMRQAKEKGYPIPRIYACVGDQDQPVMEACHKLERLAVELGFDVTTSYGIGKHDFIYWDGELRNAMYNWLPLD